MTRIFKKIMASDGSVYLQVATSSSAENECSFCAIGRLLNSAKYKNVTSCRGIKAILFGSRDIACTRGLIIINLNEGI